MEPEELVDMAEDQPQTLALDPLANLEVTLQAVEDTGKPGDDGQPHSPALEGEDDDDPQVLANRFGALSHLRSGRVHLCSDLQLSTIEKTRCGIKTENLFKLKVGISEYDLLRARCFQRPTISLPGRQALTL